MVNCRPRAIWLEQQRLHPRNNLRVVLKALHPLVEQLQRDHMAIY